MSNHPPDNPTPGWSAPGRTPDVLPDLLGADAAAPAGKRAPWPLVAGAAALVLALVGGVTYAVGALSGGGQQAAEALPAGALGLVSVDLDPPAGQKIDGFRFLRKFPSLREHVPLDGDARELVFDAIADEAGWAQVDFDRDVSSWLGKRLAVAAYPPAGDGSQPVVVVALQVTDTGKADTGLAKLARAASSDGGGPAQVGWAFSGDYALVAENSMVAKDLATQAVASPLAGDAHFAADTDAVDDGVVLAWADLGRAGDVLGDTFSVPGSLAGEAQTGRTTLVARFDGPDVFEVSGTTTGVASADWATHQVHGMADLPSTSAVAFGMADGDVLAARAWEAAQGFLGVMGGGAPDVEDELGLTMPDDLATLLGTNLLVALDGGKSSGVQLGARITTDVVAAGRVLDTLEGRSLGVGLPDFPLQRRTVGGDLVVAATKAQADRMATDGALGDVAIFRDALPDLDGASLALWVDPAGVEAVIGLGDPDPDLAALKGIGVTVGSTGQGAATFRVRLVAH